MNVICLGGRVVGVMLAWELIETFLTARFRPQPRFARRLEKVAALEKK
jgi:ribose 5-phosphate isomerase B